ncbi:MAG TPA: hypothetical protein VKQ11_00075 [Candidatus Sulfotelmatobacter sp.]|nr:hypothetical protein [Candidatus Sulfotelmatobacter sp.]
MELKRLITQFTYRIEPKPEGGFIAHASDPAVPPLEAATREELQQKIQATIAAGLAAQFPGLKLPAQNGGLKFAFHIERKPGGEFSIQSADPNAPPIEGATHEEIESPFAEKLFKFVGKHFLPELSEALAKQGGSGDIRVFVNGKTGLTVKAGENTMGLGSRTSVVPARFSQASGTTIEEKAADRAANADFGSAAGRLSNRPITPESNSGWLVFLVSAAMLILGGLIYLLSIRR